MITVGEHSYHQGLGVEFEYRGLKGESNLVIGKFCAIGYRSNFILRGGHIMGVSTYPFKKRLIGCDDNSDEAGGGDITIGNDVWLGNDVTVIGPSTIGDGAIVGARGVVAKDIPPYAIAVGNPIRIIKYRFSPDVIEKMLKIKWWDWDIETIKARYVDLNYVSPEEFISKYYKEGADA